MLPQALIDRLRYVEILTTRAVRNHRAGAYLSRIRGRSFEFDEHKPYQPGDDTRQIDWNVTARMQSPFVKRELEEKELGVMILVDVSRSMLFTSTGQSKKDLAVEAAAVLAFSAAADNINTGLLAFTDQVECYFPPKRGALQAWRLIEALYNLQPRGQGTCFGPALETLNSILKHTALIFCLSDFVEAASFWDSQYLTGVLHRADFVPMILEDRWEQTLPETSGYVRLKDTESREDRVLTLSPRKSRQYRSILHERSGKIRTRFYRLGLDHMELGTGDDYLKQIMTFLGTKKRRRS
jgi:uncharacterized protein (DUF58 family)